MTLTRRSAFSRDVMGKLGEVIDSQKAAHDFSEQMREAMGLSPEEIELAREHNMRWVVGEYCIFPDSYAWHDAFGDWVTVLTAVPRKAVDPDQEYISPNDDADWTNWHHVSKGTATVTYPLGDGRREHILKLLRERAAG